MVRPKTEEEIELLRENAILVSKTLAEVGKAVAPGVTTMELNRVAETFIRDNGAVPSFLGFEGFPAAICASVNDTVVHGFPSDYVLKEGDIVSCDIGTLYKGYNGDSAYTFPVGEVDERTRQLLDVTKESLYRGIAAAVAGARIGDIGYAVQSYAESFGFSVVRELEGHGIGKGMHENPGVPNYGRRGKGPQLFEGETMAEFRAEFDSRIEGFRKVLRTFSPDDAEKLESESPVTVTGMLKVYGEVFSKVQGAALGE